MQFLAQDLFADQQRHDVVKPKCRDVHPTVSPLVNQFLAVVKSLFHVVAPLAGGCQAVDVLNQASAVIHARPAFGVSNKLCTASLGRNW